MEFLVLIFCLIPLFVITFIIANAGSKRKIGFGWALFLGLFLSPIISLIAVLLSDKINPDEYGRIERNWGCFAPLFTFLFIIGVIGFILIVVFDFHYAL